MNSARAASKDAAVVDGQDVRPNKGNEIPSEPSGGGLLGPRSPFRLLRRLPKPTSPRKSSRKSDRKENHPNGKHRTADARAVGVPDPVKKPESPRPSRCHVSSNSVRTNEGNDCSSSSTDTSTRLSVTTQPVAVPLRVKVEGTKSDGVIGDSAPSSGSLSNTESFPSIVVDSRATITRVLHDAENEIQRSTVPVDLDEEVCPIKTSLDYSSCAVDGTNETGAETVTRQIDTGINLVCDKKVHATESLSELKKIREPIENRSLNRRQKVTSPLKVRVVDSIDDIERYFGGETTSRRERRRNLESWASPEARRSRSQPPKSPLKRRNNQNSAATFESILDSKIDTKEGNSIEYQDRGRDAVDVAKRRTPIDVDQAGSKLQDSTKQKFNKLLNAAYRKCIQHASTRRELKTIVDMIKKDASLCKLQFSVDLRKSKKSHGKQESLSTDNEILPSNQPIVLYPIHILCALGATPFVIRMAWKAFPPAVTMPSDPLAAIGSPLHYACLFQTHHHISSPKEMTTISYLEVVQFLVTKNPALLVCSMNQEKRTPLHMACLCHYTRAKPLDSKVVGKASHPVSRHVGGFKPDDNDSTSTCSTGSSSSSSGDRLPLICSALTPTSSCHILADTVKCKDAVSLKMSANGNEVLAFLTKMFPRAVNKVDIHGYTPLHLACINGSPSYDVVEHMIRLYPEACLVPSLDGSTPLHKAVEQTIESSEKFELILKIVKLLLKGNGHQALVMKDKRGYLPLHVCTLSSTPLPSNFHHKLLKFLVKKYPDGLNSHDMEGRTPRMMATSMALEQDIVRILSPFV